MFQINCGTLPQGSASNEMKSTYGGPNLDTTVGSCEHDGGQRGIESNRVIVQVGSLEKHTWEDSLLLHSTVHSLPVAGSSFLQMPDEMQGPKPCRSELRLELVD